MRATVVRRTALAASVASLALLATACGGSDADSGAKADGAASGDRSGSAKPVVKALTAAELEKASLAQGDVAGHKVTKAGAEDLVGPEDVTVDKKECEPFGLAYAGAKRGTPVATAARQVVQEPKKGAGTDPEDVMKAAFDVTSTLVTLASYEGDGAGKRVAELRDSAAACAAGGFTVTVKGDKTKILKLAEEKVTGGEETVAWTVTAEQDGTKTPLKLASLRQGGTVATFLAFNLGVVANGKADFDMPSDVVAAQVKKLG